MTSTGFRAFFPSDNDSASASSCVPSHLQHLLPNLRLLAGKLDMPGFPPMASFQPTTQHMTSSTSVPEDDIQEVSTSNNLPSDSSEPNQNQPDHSNIDSGESLFKT